MKWQSLINRPCVDNCENDKKILSFFLKYRLKIDILAPIIQIYRIALSKKEKSFAKIDTFLTFLN